MLRSGRSLEEKQTFHYEKKRNEWDMHNIDDIVMWVSNLMDIVFIEGMVQVMGI